MTVMMNDLFRFHPGRAAGVAVAWLMAAACSSGSGNPALDAPSAGGLDGPAAETTRDLPQLADAAPTPDTRDAALDVQMDTVVLPDMGGMGDLARGVVVSGAGCTDLQRGALVTPGRLVVLPPLSGGSPPDGTYDSYVEEGTLILRDRAATSLRLAGGNFAWVRFIERLSFPDDFEERSSGPYSISGGTITFAGTCGPLVDRPFMFSHSGDELVLHRQGLLLRMRRRP